MSQPTAAFVAAAGGSSSANPQAGSSSDAAATRWYQADPAALDQLTPEGVADEPHDSRWTIHPEGQWIFGNHPEATPAQLQQLEQILQRNKGAFA